jgi:hypothetical protein
LQGDQKAAEANVPIVNWTSQKTAVTHTFVRPDPAEYMKASNENKRVMRGKIVLDGLKVEFYEQPKDIDFYDSTVEVKRQGEVSRSYNVGELIKHQALSLVHVALIPSSAGSGMLVCEYEGGATGAREGFAILRFSPAGVELHTLPLTDYGKVVVFKSKPERAEIWSSLEDGAGAAAAAAPKAYATRSCRWSAEGYACGPPKRKPGHFSPTDINDPGIEIRP